MSPTYSLIVPVYKNEGSIGELVLALETIKERLDAELEVVFVVDGSPDRSADELVKALPQASFRSQMFLLSRNFGSFAAIRVGLSKASGRFFAVMAADLQEPPELALDCFSCLARDEADVVLGTRSGREDPLLGKLASSLYWWVYRKFVQAETPPGGVDVFGCNEAFRVELLKLDEANSSLVGLVLWLGFRRRSIPYSRMKRRHGKSSWTLRRKLRYLSNSAFSFSNTPIQVLLWMGFFGLVISLLFAVIVVWVRLAGDVPVPGYAAEILTIIFFGSLNLTCLGIVGSYLWRAFENTKQRPGAIVMRELRFPPRSDP